MTILEPFFSQQRHEEIMDAAMTLWEVILEECMGPKDTIKAINGFRSEYGVAETRSKVAALAPACHDLWEQSRKHGFDDCFDYEFVPIFLQYCVEVTYNDIRCKYEPDQYNFVGRLIYYLWEGRNKGNRARQALNAVHAGQSPDSQRWLIED